MDTQIAGIFRQIPSGNDGEKPQFLASPDFLGACKLKMKDMGEAVQDSYAEIYNAAAKQAQVVNFGSIAMVCDKGVKSETVYGVLKDMFSKIIENSKDRALNIALKDVGHIVYSPSAPGYLSFTDKRPDDPDMALGKQKLTIDNVEQLSTMLDTISNKLSTDGATLSVRSGYFSNLSIKTPGSRFSKPQSVTSIARRPGYWADHRRKLRKAQVVDSDSIFEAQSMGSKAREAGGARLFKQMAEFGYNPEPTGATRKRIKAASLLPDRRVPQAPEYQPNIILNEKRSEEAAASSENTARTTATQLPFPFLNDMMAE